MAQMFGINNLLVLNKNNKQKKNKKRKSRRRIRAAAATAAAAGETTRVERRLCTATMHAHKPHSFLLPHSRLRDRTTTKKKKELRLRVCKMTSNSQKCECPAFAKYTDQRQGTSAKTHTLASFQLSSQPVLHSKYITCIECSILTKTALALSLSLCVIHHNF